MPNCGVIGDEGYGTEYGVDGLFVRSTFTSGTLVLLYSVTRTPYFWYHHRWAERRFDGSVKKAKFNGRSGWLESRHDDKQLQSNQFNQSNQLRSTECSVRVYSIRIRYKVLQDHIRQAAFFPPSPLSLLSFFFSNFFLIWFLDCSGARDQNWLMQPYGWWEPRMKHGCTMSTVATPVTPTCTTCTTCSTRTEGAHWPRMEYACIVWGYWRGNLTLAYEQAGKLDSQVTRQVPKDRKVPMEKSKEGASSIRFSWLGLSV